MNVSIEKVVDDENGYWCELNYEPAKKPVPEKAKKARSPLKEKDDNLAQRCKSAETKRKSMLDEKAEKARKDYVKAKQLSNKIKIEKEGKRQAIVKDLDDRMKKHEKHLQANLNEKKSKHAKEFQRFKKSSAPLEKELQKKCDETLKKTIKKLDMAEKKRDSLHEKIKITNAEKTKKFEENKEINKAKAAEFKDRC